MEDQNELSPYDYEGRRVYLFDYDSDGVIERWLGYASLDGSLVFDIELASGEKVSEVSLYDFNLT
jgi:hypothetical protein